MQQQVMLVPVVGALRRALRIGSMPLLWTGAFGLATLAIFEVGTEASRWLVRDVLIVAPIMFASAIQLAVLSMRAARANAERQRTELASVLHDLRAPLLTTRSYLDLLASEALGPMPGEARDAAASAAVAAARAQALMAALGGTVVTGVAERAELVRLDEVLADVVAALHAEIAAAGAVIEVGDLPAVHGEREALYRVFANLVENAVKYRRRDGSTARVVVSAIRDGKHWRIGVRDWGIGILPTERTRVFEPGQRGRRVGDRPGQGLGLATVRSLVQAHGGQVEVDAAVTDGVCIEVMLPGA